jgi:hypothetical protein
VLYTLLCLALLFYVVPALVYVTLLLVLGTAVGTSTLCEALGQVCQPLGHLLRRFHGCGPWFDYAVAAGVVISLVLLAGLVG